MQKCGRRIVLWVSLILAFISIIIAIVALDKVNGVVNDNQEVSN